MDGKQTLCPGILARPAAQGVQGWLPVREKVLALQVLAGDGDVEAGGEALGAALPLKAVLALAAELALGLW